MYQSYYYDLSMYCYSDEEDLFDCYKEIGLIPISLAFRAA